ncbi:MAG: SLBB domain-containing protein [Chloroflexi bacterium]|jgi:NADH-quinone oxidoreductase subunit F|nr:SLBB domain-containing protein [Chloroflexota bacterium]
MTEILATPAAWPRILLPADAPADPLDLDTALAAGAFAGLRRAARELGPTGTLATVAAAGLRGRGGAGFATAEKWRDVAAQPDGARFVVVNAVDGDPGVSIGRELLARRPYAVLEGAAIAALATGAATVVVAVRAEDGAGRRALEAALAAAGPAGLLGDGSPGSGAAPAFEVRPVRGGLLLGEETVLLNVLANRRAQAEQRPPYPSERGLGGHPTAVHNVATLACVPWILAHGPEAFAALGDPAAPGTALVQLSGAVASPGIAEVPTGTTLAAIVDLAGGVPAGRSPRAVLVGGPSGGLLPPTAWATPYSPGPLRAAGAHPGSGSIVVVDETTCPLDLARLLVRYCADEACGKSIPCRIGTRRMAEIAERLASGRSRPSDPQLALDLAADIDGSALCDHERLACTPLLSVLRHFGPDVEAHRGGTCPAGVCLPCASAPGAAGPGMRP